MEHLVRIHAHGLSDGYSQIFRSALWPLDYGSATKLAIWQPCTYLSMHSCGSTPRGLDQQGGAEGGGGGGGGPPIQPIPPPPPPSGPSSAPPVVSRDGCAKVPPLDLTGKAISIGTVGIGYCDYHLVTLVSVLIGYCDHFPNSQKPISVL